MGREISYFIPIYYTQKRYYFGTYRKDRSKLEAILDMNIQLFEMSPLYLAGLLYFILFRGFTGIPEFITGLILGYVGSQTVYEIGYLINDNIAYFREGSKARNVFGEFLTAPQIIGGSLIRIIVFSAIFAILLRMFSLKVVVEYSLVTLLMLLVFIMYNMIKPFQRAIYLFFNLRFVKYTSMFFFLTETISLINIIPYIMALSIEGTITYSLRKIPKDEVGLRLKLYQKFLQILTVSTITYVTIGILNEVNWTFFIIQEAILGVYIILTLLLQRR